MDIFEINRLHVILQAQTHMHYIDKESKCIIRKHVRKAKELVLWPIPKNDVCYSI